MASFFYHRLLIALLGWYCCFFSILPSATEASSASTYNPIHYDRMRHFTPDGRLLQVEYAMRAAEHSSPLAVCRLDEDTLVLLAIQKRSAQDRLVVVDDGVAVVALSGVLADSLALLRVAHREWLDWKTLRGQENAHPRVSIHVLSKAIAERCHAHSFQQGIRPFGASLLLATATPSSSREPFSVLQTDPSGAVVEIPSQQEEEEGGGGEIRLLKIVGGDAVEGKKIEAAIQKWNDNAANQDATIADKLQSLTRIMMQAREKEPSGGSLFKRNKKKQKEEEEKKKKSLLPKPKVEVVLVSKKLGVHRLTKEQIKGLMGEEDEAAA